MTKRALAGVFVEALEAERDSINQRFRFANVNGPNIEPGALFDFLTICADPVVASAAEGAPERVRPLVRELIDISFALFSSHLLSNERRSPWLERLWREVLAKVPLLVAMQPNLVAGRLNNALANIASHPGARPDEWLSLLAVAAPTLESSEQLFQTSTVAAWMSGMAQYRSAAVKQLQTPNGLSLARRLLQDSELDETIWARHVERMADDPWLLLEEVKSPDSNLTAKRIRHVSTLGGFSGFEGMFRFPPTVHVRSGRFYVTDSESTWHLLADAYGSSLSRVGRWSATKVPPAKTRPKGSPRLSANGQLQWGTDRATFAELTEATSQAFDGRTLAVTIPTSFRLFMVARGSTAAPPPHAAR